MNYSGDYSSYEGWGTYKDRIRYLLMTNIVTEHEEQMFEKVRTFIGQCSEDELEEMVKTFTVTFYNRIKEGLPISVWTPKILQAIIQDKDGMSILMEYKRKLFTKYGELVNAIEDLIHPFVRDSTLLPRELSSINNRGFSVRDINRLIGEYTYPKYLRDVGERSIHPQRVLSESKHHAFTDRNIGNIIRKYEGFHDYGIPLFTPRQSPQHSPVRLPLSPRRSPRTLSPPRPRPSGTRGRSPNRRPSSTRSKPRRSRK